MHATCGLWTLPGAKDALTCSNRAPQAPTVWSHECLHTTSVLSTRSRLGTCPATEAGKVPRPQKDRSTKPRTRVTAHGALPASRVYS